MYSHKLALWLICNVWLTTFARGYALEGRKLKSRAPIWGRILRPYVPTTCQARVGATNIDGITEKSLHVYALFSNSWASASTLLQDVVLVLAIGLQFRNRFFVDNGGWWR